MVVTAAAGGEVLAAWLTDRVVVEVVDLDRMLFRRGWVLRERLSEQSVSAETVGQTQLPRVVYQDPVVQQTRVKAETVSLDTSQRIR